MTQSQGKDFTFAKVDEICQSYMYHRHLRTRQVHQFLSRFHLDAAELILNAAGVEEETAIQVIAAVLLLHQGLSIHDQVDLHDSERRQLYVLAGDHDSAQYYFVLAQLSDLELLNRLCEAVVHINEAKMQWLKHSSEVAAERYLALQQVIQGALLKALVTHYMPGDVRLLHQVESLVTAYIIQEDLKSKKNFKHISLRQAYEWLSAAMDRMSTTRVSPFGSFVHDYLAPIYEAIEHLRVAEGNH